MVVPASAHRKRLNAEDRRRTLIDAAAVVFAEAGYERARVADVAKKVGVTEPVVFQNFGTKAALFEATVEHVADAYSDHIRHLATRAGSAWQALAAMTRPTEFRRLHRPGGAGVLFAAAMGSAAVPATRRALARIHGALSEVVELGQRQGSIRADLDPGTLAWWVLATFPAHAFRQAHGGGGADEEALHQLALEALLPASAKQA